MAALRSAAGPSLFKRFFGLIEVRLVQHTTWPKHRAWWLSRQEVPAPQTLFFCTGGRRGGRRPRRRGRDIANPRPFPLTLFFLLFFPETQKKHDKTNQQNQPLYVMVGIACGLAVYTPIRHVTHAPDIALGASDRDAAAGYEEGAQAGSGRTLEKAWSYRSGGVLAKAARLNEYGHVIPDYGVPDTSHFEWKKGKKVLDVRDMPVPRPE